MLYCEYGQCTTHSGGSDCIKVWAWSDITTSSKCQPKTELVAKEARRHDCEVNSMAVNNVSCTTMVHQFDLLTDTNRTLYTLDVEIVVFMCGICRTSV